MPRVYDNWINGKWARSPAGNLVHRRAPGSGEHVASFTASSIEDVDQAISYARRSFDSGVWSEQPGMERARVLNRLAALIDEHRDTLAQIEAEESGKPIRFAKMEVSWSAELTRFAATLAYQLKGEAFTNLGTGAIGLVTREPRGVIAMIVPWNFPMVCLFQKLPFAIAAGCSTVIKPSELTSGTALEIARLCTLAGVPDGVVNVVTGPGRSVGGAITNHRDVDMVSFTGSTSVGKQIARNTADRVARVALELGGKAANVVFADADIPAAVDGVLFGALLNQGEECAAGTRLIIEESIAKDFLADLVARTQYVRVGDPLNEQTDVGAMIHEQHMDQVLALIEAGKREGATLLCGGHRLTGEAHDAGYFIAPTIFADVTPDMRIFREEIFGPVLCVTTFKTVEEAVALANDTCYGLANGLWSKDIDKVHQVSRRLKSGTVYVNTYLETSPQLPFGGFKESGVGRELGLDALAEFTEVKSTFIKLGDRPAAFPHCVGRK